MRDEGDSEKVGKIMKKHKIEWKDNKVKAKKINELPESVNDEEPEIVTENDIEDSDDIQLRHDKAYEPEWGHNSGNSYNNGPTTHFYHGDASPYSVTNENI